MTKLKMRVIDSPVYKFFEKEPDKWYGYEEIICSLKKEVGYSKHHITRLLTRMVKEGLLAKKVLEDRRTKYRLSPVIQIAKDLMSGDRKIELTFRAGVRPAPRIESIADRMAKEHNLEQIIGKEEYHTVDRLLGPNAQYFMNWLWNRTMTELLMPIGVVSSIIGLFGALDGLMRESGEGSIPSEQKKEIYKIVEAIIDRWDLEERAKKILQETIDKMDKIIAIGRACDEGKLGGDVYGLPLSEALNRLDAIRASDIKPPKITNITYT